MWSFGSEGGGGGDIPDSLLLLVFLIPIGGEVVGERCLHSKYGVAWHYVVVIMVEVGYLF